MSDLPSKLFLVTFDSNDSIGKTHRQSWTMAADNFIDAERRFKEEWATSPRLEEANPRIIEIAEKA